MEKKYNKGTKYPGPKNPKAKKDPKPLDQRRLIYSQPENMREKSKCAIINCTSRSEEVTPKTLRK